MIERSDTSDGEVLDGLPVLAPEAQSRLPAVRSVAPVAQAAAVAAGGFVAGAVVVGVLGHRRRQALSTSGSRRLMRRGRDARRLPEIVESRSLLVDFHLLAAPARGG